MTTKTIFLAGGCFWGVQELIRELQGVLETEVGYMGGTLENPTYDHVKLGNTGHAETVRIVYDPARLSLTDLLVHHFFRLHDHSITYRIAVGAKRGQKVFQLQLLSPSDEPAFGSTDPCARYAGFNLHAGLKIGAKRRDKLERLCRYMSRPPLAHARLSLTEEDKVCYRLKTPFRNGTTHVIFEPADFIAKLAALVPLPGVNLTRYFGVFAPASKVRREIVPKAVGRTRSCSGADDAVAKLVEEGGSAGCRRSDYIPWAKLLKRVFKIEVEKCALCGARVKVVAVINEHKLIEKILAHLERVGRQVRLRLSYDDIVAQYRGPPELAV